MDRKQILGISGAALLFIGAFAPFASLPVGTLVFAQSDVMIIMVGIAAFTLVLTLQENYKSLGALGGASLGILVLYFINFQSIQLQWGWAISVIGALLVFSAAVLDKKDDEKVALPLKDNNLSLDIDKWEFSEGTNLVDDSFFQEPSYLTKIGYSFLLMFVILTSVDLILSLLVYDMSSFLYPKILTFMTTAALVLSFFFVFFYLRAKTISIPCPNPKVFLARLNALLKVSHFYPYTRRGDLFVFLWKLIPFSHAKFLSPLRVKILVQIGSDSVTIISPPIFLNLERHLKQFLKTPASWNGESPRMDSTPLIPSVHHAAKPSVETRLSELKDLLDKGFVNSQEYERKRAEILKEL